MVRLIESKIYLYYPALREKSTYPSVKSPCRGLQELRQVNSTRRLIIDSTNFQFLVHLSRRLNCTIVIMCCPSSVRRLSSLTFHIFIFSSETAKQNSTKLDRKQDLNALYQVCVFRADRKNKMATLASGWLRHFRLLL